MSFRDDINAIQFREGDSPTDITRTSLTLFDYSEFGRRGFSADDMQKIEEMIRKALIEIIALAPDPDALFEASLLSSTQTIPLFWYGKQHSACVVNNTTGQRVYAPDGQSIVAARRPKSIDGLAMNCTPAEVRNHSSKLFAKMFHEAVHIVTHGATSGLVDKIGW